MKWKQWIRTLAAVRLVFSCAGEFSRLLGGASVVFLWDQLFKHSIDAEPEENFPRELPLGRGRVDIVRAHNRGFSQGRLEHFPEFVRLFSFGLTAFLAGVMQAYCMVFPRKHRIEKLGAMLLLGGAISNTYDRIAHGFVTDYLHIRVGALKKSIVNLGDIAITGGMAVYLLGTLLSLLRGEDHGEA